MLRALVFLSLQLIDVLSWTKTTTTVVFSWTQANRSFASSRALRAPVISLALSETKESTTNNNGNKSGDNKAMAFLRKIGKVGGNNDFTHAIGVDEGESGKASGISGTQLKKSANAYTPCAISGIIDDVTQPFPWTSFGTSWSGFTDQAVFSTRGGKNSMATLSRRDNFHGRSANVLSGTVIRHAPFHKEGFIQMATNLATNSVQQQRQQQGQSTTTAATTVQNSIDASAFQGVRLKVFYEHGSRRRLVDDDDADGDEKEDDSCDIPQSKFYVQFKTRDTSQEEPSAAASLSYRAEFPVTPCIQEKSGAWTTVQIPWKDFVPHATTTPAGLKAATTTTANNNIPLDPTALVRIGIVVANNDNSSSSSNQENTMAISEKIVLGISGVEFYKE